MARASTCVVAAETVCARTAQTPCSSARARLPIFEFTGAVSVARLRGAGAGAHIVLIGRHVGACSDAPRDVARFARTRAGRIATDVICAESGQTIRVHCAGNAQIEFARAGTIAGTVRAFTIGILACGNNAAYAIVPRTFLGCRARIARAHARRVTTNAVDTIVRGAIRWQHAGLAIAAFAETTAVAHVRSAANWVRIRSVVGNVRTRSE